MRKLLGGDEVHRPLGGWIQTIRQLTTMLQLALCLGSVRGVDRALERPLERDAGQQLAVGCERYLAEQLLVTGVSHGQEDPLAVDTNWQDIMLLRDLLWDDIEET